MTIGINLRLPLGRDKTNGLIMNKSYNAAIRQNFRMLMLTSPGERVMDPDYGVGLKMFLFENLDANATLEDDLEDRINQQVRKYLPQINVEKVEMTQKSRENLSVIIEYYIRGTNSFDVLEISV